MTKQDYINRAEMCLKGIECIKEAINKADTREEKMELACKFESDLNTLIKTYYLARAEYDRDFKKLLEEKNSDVKH